MSGKWQGNLQNRSFCSLLPECPKNTCEDGFGVRDCLHDNFRYGAEGLGLMV